MLQGIGISGDWKFLFQGKEYVDAFGLNTYDFGWRMGDPFTGRWTSTDPVDQFKNITAYGYMANNPLLYTDPDGRILPAVFIAAAVVGGGLNLWNNWSKIKDWKQGVGYFISGAAGGAVGVTNPLLGGGITSGANALIDIASGSMPSIQNFGDGAKYFLGETAKGIAFSYAGGQVGKYIGPKLGSFFDWVQQGFVKYAPGTAKIGDEVISWTYEAGVKASRKLFGQAGQAIGSSAANQVDDIINHTIQDAGSELGARFTYANQHTIELLANKNVTGKTLELTDMVFYARDAAGNELKNEFGTKNMLKTFGKLKDYAKEHGFENLRLQFERAANSSSKNPGHVFDMIFKLK